MASNRNEDALAFRMFEARTLRWRNREREYEYARKMRLWGMIASIAILIGFIIWAICHSVSQPIKMRAAYLEGRYGLSQDTAMELALAERETSR